MPLGPKQQPPYYVPETMPTPGEPPGKLYRAIISQTGTSAPTANVIYNTIGNIAWTRSGVGLYVGTLASAFTENKTLLLTSTKGTGGVGFVQFYRASANSVFLFTWGANAIAADGIIESIDIQIIVQN